MLGEKEVYGLIVIDRREAYIGFLRGNRIEPVSGVTSMVPGKQRKGGQSSVRFQRLRLIAINEFYKKVGERASDIFLAEKDFFERFKGVLIGGPTPTKEEFEAGGYPTTNSRSGSSALRRRLHKRVRACRARRERSRRLEGS